MHFGDANIVLSSRVNENSKILYDRTPRERVQKVAPWLTVDSDALPAVVDGKIVWILDGYTTSDKYPLAEKKSLQEMTSDAINPRSAYATLPTDQINYMRNAVKATVDAYDGTVKLYEWDTSDPILKVWEKAFPGVVKKKSEIPAGRARAHALPRGPVQGAARHARGPTTCSTRRRSTRATTSGTSRRTRSTSTRKQPPYRLSVADTSGETPVFSLTSVFVPQKKQNLASFMSVGADASKPDSYGKFQILRLPDNTQVPGPGQIANQFSNDPKVASELRAFKQADAKVAYGNLLTLPVGGGLLYVQPLYTLREGGSGNYPVLRFVLTSFGRDVGIGSTLAASLNDVLGAAPAGDSTPDDQHGQHRHGLAPATARTSRSRRSGCSSRPTTSSARPTRRSRPATSRATRRRSAEARALVERAITAK